MTQSVPGAVRGPQAGSPRGVVEATGYQSMGRTSLAENNPVATAPGTDIITSASLVRRQGNLNRRTIPGSDLQERSRVA